jgi:hypothetical protein
VSPKNIANEEERRIKKDELLEELSGILAGAVILNDPIAPSEDERIQEIISELHDL